jgi:hypothetical protein
MNEDFIERVWEEAKLLFLEGGEELIPTLIALAYSYGMDDEREACAKVCDDLVLAHPGRADLTADQCAEAIRARGAQMSDAINPDRYKQGDKDCIDAINPNHYKQGDKEGIDALRAALWNGIRARGSK